MKTNRKTKSNPTLQWALEIVAIAQDKKGKDITLLQVESLVDYADYFVFVTGGNRRQVQAVSEAIENAAKDKEKRVRVEGYASGWWIVLDASGVVVHVFQEDARAFYELDHLWGDAPRIAVPKPKASVSVEEQV